LQRFEAEERGEARGFGNVSCFDGLKHSRRFYPFIQQRTGTILPTFAVDEYFYFRWLVQFTHASIYRCSQTPPNAAPKSRQVSHPRKSQMTVLMRPHCANACFFPHGRSASGSCPDTLAYHKLLWQAHTIRHPAICYRPLHLAHGYHLLPQVVLVFANATIPPSDCPVLTNQDIFRNLIEQSAGMLAKNSST
jgi:hypothetical protein